MVCNGAQKKEEWQIGMGASGILGAPVVLMCLQPRIKLGWRGIWESVPIRWAVNAPGWALTPFRGEQKVPLREMLLAVPGAW